MTGQLLHRGNVHLLDIRRPVTRSFLSSLPSLQFISEYELSDDNARCYHPLLHTYPTNQVGLENNHRVQVGQVLKVQVQVLQDQVTNQDSNIMDSVQDMRADPYLTEPG